MKSIPAPKDISRASSTAKNHTYLVEDASPSFHRFISAMACEFTNSPEEAEAAAREICIDICKYVEQGNTSSISEAQIVSVIARRRLATYVTTR